MTVTCAECQDLLLDLAYGELDAARAADVEAHIAGCAACHAERAKIAGVRTLVAPLLKTEEPSAAMDEVILRAARDQAERMAAGTGQKPAARAARVVEVAAMTSAPEAVAPVDVRARVQPPAPEKAPRRRWMLRVAAVGSLAAAASLTLVVTSSRRMSPQEASVAPEEPPREIRIRVPGEAQPPRPAKKGEPPRAAPAVERENAELRAKVAELERTSAEAARRPQDEKAIQQTAAAKRELAKADAPKLPEAKHQAAPPPAPPPLVAAPRHEEPAAAEAAPAPEVAAPPQAAATPPAAAAGGGTVSSEAMKELPAVVQAPAIASAAPPRPQEKGKMGRRSAAVAEEDRAAPRGVPDAIAGSRGVGIGDLRAGSLDAAGPAAAAQLEARARAARHGGGYTEAANLYRQAAALHRRNAETGQQPMASSNRAEPLDVAPPKRADATDQAIAQKAGPPAKDQFAGGQESLMAAAWDLAHAIECLAANAETEEARRVYQELLSQYSFAQGPIAAAARALRVASPQRPASTEPASKMAPPSQQ